MIEPLFSVVLPAYNVEKTIKVCLDSVVDQTFPFFELVVCNDGSTDKTKEIIESYVRLDERIKFIDRPHKGISWARQACLEEASASYIVFLDGDDALEPNCLEEFAKAVDLNDPDIVCCGFRLVKGENFEDIKIQLNTQLYQRKDVEKEIFPYIFSPKENNNLLMKLWAKAIRKDLIFQEHSLINPEISSGQDFAIMASCIYRAESVFISDHCLYDYRDQDKNVFSSFDISSPKQYSTMLKHIQDRVDVYSEELKMIFKWTVLDWLFYQAAKQISIQGDSRETREKIEEVFKNSFFKEIISDLEAKRLSKEGMKLNSVQNCKFHRIVKESRQLKKSRSLAG